MRSQNFETKLKEAGFEVSVSAMPMSPEVHQVLLVCAHASAGVEARLCTESGHENDENHSED